MGLLQVILDWVLMFIIMIGKMFYWRKLIKEDTSILMEMMKYLIANDVISAFIILIHDIPSYFMEDSLSERVYLFHILGIFSQCLPFFFALLMLPMFSLLNLIAIIAVYRFVSLKKSHISKSSIIFCYIGSILLTVPLLTHWCGFAYNNTTHYWFYDYNKPYTIDFQRFNIILQIVCMTIVAICMTLVLIYLANRAKHFSTSSSKFPQVDNSSVSSKVNQTNAVEPTLTLETRSTPHNARIVRSRSILDQGFAFIILSLCFILGTTAFNLLSTCDSTTCLVVTVITGNLNRAKWIIYCFLMRQEATLSRLFK